MVSEGTIEEEERGYQLTEQGREEAIKVLRAHRLWEAYLEKIGVPEDELHQTAHKMEHKREDGTIEYLDEKLGNPETDPHGKEIPSTQ